MRAANPVRKRPEAEPPAGDWAGGAAEDRFERCEALTVPRDHETYDRYMGGRGLGRSGR
jgi:hypothetical protein